MKKPIKTAVILAAGKGTRLRPYTQEIPKGFMQVGEERLVERSIRILKEHGIENVLIGTGYLSEHYERLAEEQDLQTFKNEDFDTTGSFHTLICGRDAIESDFLLLESDLLYHSEAIKVLLDDERTDIILCSGFTKSNDEVFAEVNDGKLSALSKKREELRSIDAELVGIWKISYELYDLLKKHHSQSSDGTKKDYEMAIAEMSSQHQVHALKVEDLVWCEIDNEEHLERARQQILPKLD